MKITFDPQNLSEAKTMHDALNHWRTVQRGITRASQATPEEKATAAQECLNVDNLLERSVQDG